jgi:hypothetical protein
LWECENVQILLEALDNWTLKNDNFTLNYKKKTFILGYHKEKNSLISNTILLAIKNYIYTCRCLSKNLALPTTNVSYFHFLFYKNFTVDLVLF